MSVGSRAWVRRCARLRAGPQQEITARLKAVKAFVWGVYVGKKVRGQGLGRALLSELMARARTYPGLEQLILGVGTTQGSARALYRSLGFEPFGLERRGLKVGTEYIDEEHMVLWLVR